MDGYTEEKSKYVEGGSHKARPEVVGSSSENKDLTKKRLDSAETRLKKIELDFEEQSNKINKFIETTSSQVSDNLKKVDDIKINLIEIIGIFVTIFTFVSTNINIFTKIDRLSSGIWFMFLMFLCLSDFLVLLHIVSSSLYGRDKSIFSEFRDWWIVFFLIMTLFVLTMIFTGKVYDIFFINLTF